VNGEVVGNDPIGIDHQPPHILHVNDVQAAAAEPGIVNIRYDINDVNNHVNGHGNDELIRTMNVLMNLCRWSLHQLMLS
jgi:hypothetical protein